MWGLEKATFCTWDLENAIFVCGGVLKVPFFVCGGLENAFFWYQAVSKMHFLYQGGQILVIFVWVSNFGNFCI